MNLLKIFESVLAEATIDSAGFKLIKSLGNSSTGAQLFKDQNGKKWVVKSGHGIDHMWNEYISNKAYEKFGIKVPKAFIGNINGQPCFISEYLEGSVPISHDLNTEIKNKAAKGFIFDALFANFDAVGSERVLDNMRIWNGEVYRVDVGGALLYRAMGLDKNMSDEPNEINTLRGWRNPNMARVFGGVTDDKIKAQINSIMKKFVVDGNIDWDKYKDYISKIVNQDEIGMSPDKKMEIVSKLLIRTKNLYNLFN